MEYRKQVVRFVMATKIRLLKQDAELAKRYFQMARRLLSDEGALDAHFVAIWDQCLLSLFDTFSDHEIETLGRDNFKEVVSAIGDPIKTGKGRDFWMSLRIVYLGNQEPISDKLKRAVNLLQEAPWFCRVPTIRWLVERAGVREYQMVQSSQNANAVSLRNKLLGRLGMLPE
jgi:hypothetical protein